MRRLGLKAAYLPLVASGRKRSTIRAGAKHDALGPAEFVSGRRTIPIEITDVVVKRFADLNEGDARLDGFETLDELRQTLHGFYPDMATDDPVSILYFELAIT